MAKSLRVLIVEDSEADAELVAIELRRDRYDLSYDRVDTPQAMATALQNENWDVVISDHDMPQFNATAALRLLHESGLDLPFIIVSGVIGDEAAVAAMRAGAHDYIIKSNLARLGAAVDRELREADIRREHRKKEDEKRRLLQQLEETQLELGQRVSQITALNRLLQEHLIQRGEVVEAYSELLEVLQRHMEDTSTLVARARSQPIPVLQDSLKEGGSVFTPPDRPRTPVEDRTSLKSDLENIPSLPRASSTSDLTRGIATQPIRIFIADGDESVRRAMRMGLERTDGITIVGETGDGQEVIEQARNLDPDVILVDVQTPQVGGMEIWRRLAEAGLKCRVTLLSVNAGGGDMLEGIRAGARAFLLKETGFEDLVRSIVAVHQGGLLLEPAMASRLIAGLGTDDAAFLTQREQEVLNLMGSGARNREIAEQLSLSVNTVKYHIENLYEKLGVRNRTQAVRVAGERGLCNV